MVLRRKLAIVDLSKEKVTVQDVPNSLRKALFGGRGMNVYYLYKMLGDNVDPLSPDNILIFGTGLMTGTLAPCSGRFNTTSKSPESGFLADTNCGGYFAPELKYAGFERLIIKGKAKKPVILHVTDNNIEIKDAKDYWGQTTNEAQKRIRQDLGPVEMVLCGPAGENLVRFACVRTGVKNAGGRTGLGCVMGSKNLKAVAAYGTQGLQVAHPDRMIQKVEELKNYLMSSKITPILGSVGTLLLYEVSNAFGGIRTKNSTLNAWRDDHNAAFAEPFIEKMIACQACPVHCRHRNVFGGEGPEYTTLVLLGANIGMEKYEEIIKLGNLVNDLGLDVSSTGTYLAWAIDLYQQGKLDKKLTDGEELRWGDYEQAVRIINKIARREGFGNILAEGNRAAAKLGDPNKDYLIAVKDIPQSDPHDVRYMKAFALGIATASRGADHLRSRPTLEIFFKLPLEVKERIYGKGVTADPTSYDGKALVVTWSERIFATIDCLEMCKFICHGFNSPHFVDYSWMKELVYCVTGWEMSEAEVSEVGRRTVDLERLFNFKQGMTEAHDTLPRRYFDDPSPLRAARGHHIDRQKFAKMKAEFYALHGWTEDGRVPEERRMELEAIQ
ncbi:MAG: aldehyde ferredoxin oxidoreductase family protein [Thermoplasmata archaeon]